MPRQIKSLADGLNGLGWNFLDDLSQRSGSLLYLIDRSPWFFGSKRIPLKKHFQGFFFGGGGGVGGG